MKRLFVLVVVLGSLLIEAAAFPVSAATPQIYTNDNFFTSEQDAPASFIQDEFGNFSGYTVSGKYFTQQAVVSDIYVHLQRFTIDQASFYISSFGLILADSDTVALSIYLARAGFEEAV